jgi:hypothetical protein
MINSDAELEVNLASIDRFYRMIANLRREIAPLNFRNYEILAEGPIEQIRRLQKEIDEYLGIQVAPASEHETAAVSGKE